MKIFNAGKHLRVKNLIVFNPPTPSAKWVMAVLGRLSTYYRIKFTNGNFMMKTITKDTNGTAFKVISSMDGIWTGYWAR